MAFAKAFDGFHEYGMGLQNLRKSITYGIKFIYTRVLVSPKRFETFDKRRSAVNLIYDDIRQYKIFVDASHNITHWLDAVYRKYWDARFLILTRNGKDFVSSALNMGWDEKRVGEILPQEGDPHYEAWRHLSPLQKLASYWVRKNQEWMDRSKKIPKDQIMIVKIEDCDEEMLNNIESFAGIPMKHKEIILERKCNIGTARMFPYPSQWSLEAHKRFDDIANNMMEKLGYVE